MTAFAPSLAPSLAQIRPDAPETIPVLDLAPLHRGERAALGAQLRRAFEEVGFYFVVNHGVPQTLIDDAFEASRQFHALPLEQKLALRMNKDNVGYVPVKTSVTRHSPLNANNRPNVVEAFFAKRELPPDHPDRTSGRPFRGVNLWPEALPHFRETAIAYCSAMERLALSLLPLYAIALDLPEDHFAPVFREPSFTLRLSHYPPHDAPEDNEFGLAPHTAPVS